MIQFSKITLIIAHVLWNKQAPLHFIVFWARVFSLCHNITWSVEHEPKSYLKPKTVPFFGSIVATCHTRNVVLRCFSKRTTDLKRVPWTHFSRFEDLMSISNPSSKIILQQHLQHFNSKLVRRKVLRLTIIDQQAKRAIFRVFTWL